MSNWTAVFDELDLWSEAGKTAKFWWRDDDAVTTTPQLSRLLDLQDQASVPLTLAVIPAFADAKLGQIAKEAKQLSIALHGYSHTNHAPKDEKKRELGLHRDSNIVLGQLKDGSQKLTELFPGTYNSALVPPWNRIDQELIANLPALGLSVLSTFQPRSTLNPVPGLTQVNCHLDPIDWHGSRSLVSLEKILAITLDLLKWQRTGTIDADEPLGLLTHHLVHDDAIWSFVDNFVKKLKNHPSVNFVNGLEASSS